MLPPPYSIDDGGLRLSVRVTPRARRSELAGLVEAGEGRTALAVRLAAPPVEGAANEALVEFLARALGLSKRAVRIVSGKTSRHKIVALSCSVSDLKALLESQ